MTSVYDDGTLTNRVLQPYLDAVSNVSSSNDTTVVRAVIHKLLQDSNIFLGYNIMKLHLKSSTIDSKLLNTLDLFSYGTISDYMNNTPRYMTLTEAQLTKLRQLTAWSVVIDNHHQGFVSYADIHEAAFLKGSISETSNNNNSSMPEPDPATTTAARTTTMIRETESLLSPLIASNMIVGKLSQKKMSFMLGFGHDKNDNNNTSSSGTTGNDTSTASSAFSKSLLVLQSRDIKVHNDDDDPPTTVLPKLISSLQRMRTQIHDAHQRLMTPSSSTPAPAPAPPSTASTMMTTTMPMEVERIRLSTAPATTTSAKRSRSSDGSTQNI